MHPPLSGAAAAVVGLVAFGMITVAVADVLMYLVLRYAPAAEQTVAAYGITGLLLLSGVRWVLEVGIRSGDAGDLRKLTYVPMFVWFLLWLATTCGAGRRRRGDAGAAVLMRRPDAPS